MLILVALLALVAGLAAGILFANHRRGPALQALGSELQRALAERDAARTERTRSDGHASEARQRFEQEQQARVAAETRFAQLASSRQQMEETFAVLAQRALNDANERLVAMNKTHVVGSMETKKAEFETLLKPLREMLDNYRGELQKSELTRNEVYGGLQVQIEHLMTAQASTGREAARLANALQSPVVRGSWGESSLKRCVELAGMSEFCDFAVQETFANDEGRRLRPDLIVRLPNNRVIAVDSKVPLNDYVAASNEPDDERKRQHLVSHSKNVRRHIESLSRREYQNAVGESLDFTVLFLPGEHFLSAALVTDPGIFEYAVDKKIYLASPTVLLPLLRAVAAGWKAERTEENAKKMHDAGVDLFNRFVIAMEKIAAVGKALEGTVTRYNEAIRSIDSRLWPKG
ncbi:MAG: rmuC, partial [Acidobacteria bacterium]|nr:rmuC [Acidobacteriota bacterium]